MFQMLLLFAQEGSAKPPAGGQGGFPIDMMLILILPMILMYFLVIRPGQKRQEKERAALLTNLKKNDRILTTSGIYGVVVGVSEKEDEVTVRVDDNVRLKMVKASIARNFTNEEAAAAEKAALEANKSGKKEGAA
jgi:preprotein translocase subunit YajC